MPLVDCLMWGFMLKHNRHKERKHNANITGMMCMHLHFVLEIVFL